MCLHVLRTCIGRLLDVLWTCYGRVTDMLQRLERSWDTLRIFFGLCLDCFIIVVFVIVIIVRTVKKDLHETNGVFSQYYSDLALA